MHLVLIGSIWIRTPRQVRKKEKNVKLKNTIVLPFQGQLNWQHMLDFYRKRRVVGVEDVTETSYQRYVIVGGSKAWFNARIEQDRLHVEFELDDLGQLRHLVSRIRTMFDLDTDTGTIERHLSNVAPGLIRRHGIRIPGVWSPWEAGVRAIVGQQVSVKAAIGQLNLLSSKMNDPIVGEHYFPTPQQVAEADLNFLKMPQSRKETLQRFAVFYIENPTVNPKEWIAIKGVGPWTIDYALVRGLSKPNCFLNGDLIVKKVMNEFPLLDGASASPWGSYATFHCWEYLS